METLRGLVAWLLLIIGTISLVLAGTGHGDATASVWIGFTCVTAVVAIITYDVVSHQRRRR